MVIVIAATTALVAKRDDDLNEWKWKKEFLINWVNNLGLSNLVLLIISNLSLMF